MNHEEREAYAAQLMAVLQGDEPATMLTETGTIEPPPGHELIDVPADLEPWLALTSADRKDRAAIRALRAEVLREAQTCGLAPMQDNDPLVCIDVLSAPEYDWNAFPEQVRLWLRTFQQIKYRAFGRWLTRGPGRGAVAEKTL